MNVKTIASAIHLRKLTAMKLKKDWRFKKRDVQVWLDNRTIKARKTV